MTDPRYQHQPRIVRVWRRRHLLRVPLDAARHWWAYPEEGWSIAWTNARGDADVRMQWWYRGDESCP